MTASVARAEATIRAARRKTGRKPVVTPFFDAASSTFSYVVSDGASGACAIIDSVLDYDPQAGRTSTRSADEIVAHVRSQGLRVDWLLETHVHADHLSAAPYLKGLLGGRIAIGEGVLAVQETFGKIFNADTEFELSGADFDQLFADGDHFLIGELEACVIHTPGHTPADVAYVIGDAMFVGDTLLMPDYGTARADFPGGDAALLYRSIRRLMSLPGRTRVCLCHDYMTPTRRRHAWMTTIAAQQKSNIHVRDGVSEAAFVDLRRARDAGLALPRLMLPAIQVNVRAGRLPAAEANGLRYLRIPLDVF